MASHAWASSAIEVVASFICLRRFTSLRNSTGKIILSLNVEAFHSRELIVLDLSTIVKLQLSAYVPLAI